MTIEELQAAFAEFEGDYIKFKDVQQKLSQRPDVHAFMLLDKLIPGNSDLITASEHGEFYIGINAEELAKVATRELVRELVRCGVQYSEEFDCLSMFA